MKDGLRVTAQLREIQWDSPSPDVPGSVLLLTFAIERIDPETRANIGELMDDLGERFEVELAASVQRLTLNAVKFGSVYFDADRDQFVQLITSDPEDGASLIVEPLDGNGDLYGGDLYRAEACDLERPWRTLWEATYSGPDAVPFADVR